MSAATLTFTSQDLVSEASRVFDAVRRFGSAKICTLEGEIFVMAKPDDAVARETARATVLARMDGHAQKLKALGHVPPPPAELEHINRIIAGEI
ncbi:MAG: hypothetical protein ACKVY0_06385 [Prosthecobacter sp.]|uniref:hypothetical protein n=1 Tax=Prosthecobacter sp. TaxID=1965333 RepID=UPI003903ABE9